jgi:hypothetical protein
MLKNTQINRAATKKIATALGDLNDQVVYVGGAVVSLYIDDPSADDVRPTKDLDLTMEIASIGELEALREELVMRGFIQSANDSVVCRFRYEDVLVDVMSTQEVGWAPGNQWFAKGFDQSITMPLEDVLIRILPLPYFLATKFDAFMIVQVLIHTHRMSSGYFNVAVKVVCGCSLSQCHTDNNGYNHQNYS